RQVPAFARDFCAINSVLSQPIFTYHAQVVRRGLLYLAFRYKNTVPVAEFLIEISMKRVHTPS
ncbi:wd-40 repeat-containing protein, partial [Moniliophthora roreri]